MVMTSIGSELASLNGTTQSALRELDPGAQKTSGEFPLSYGAVQRKLRSEGIVMSKPSGRYRINFFGRSSETAQFATDLEGALEAGLKLASTRKGPAW